MTTYEKIKHQIFKYLVPYEEVICLLNDICDRDEDKETYIFNNTTFKRAKLLNLLPTYMNFLNPFYHDSKKIYVRNGLSFKGLNTIIRQLCNLHKLLYERTIKYSFSKYDIGYTIYIGAADADANADTYPNSH